MRSRTAWPCRSANGKATITATAGDRTATAEVAVVDMDKPFEWSFRNHVESVLSKTGCNSGACHGALAGKKGFKLSLRRVRPGGRLLHHHAAGPRPPHGAERPGRSLVLTKPIGAVPHKGGVRFRVDSLEYRVLAEWIAAGARAGRSDDPAAGAARDPARRPRCSSPAPSSSSWCGPTSPTAIRKT